MKKNNETRRNILRIKREKRLFERIQNKISIKVKSPIKIQKNKDKRIIPKVAPRKVAPRKVEARKVPVKKPVSRINEDEVKKDIFIGIMSGTLRFTEQGIPTHKDYMQKYIEKNGFKNAYLIGSFWNGVPNMRLNNAGCYREDTNAEYLPEKNAIDIIKKNFDLYELHSTEKSNKVVSDFYDKMKKRNFDLAEATTDNPRHRLHWQMFSLGLACNLVLKFLKNNNIDPKRCIFSRMRPDFFILEATPLTKIHKTLITSSIRKYRNKRISEIDDFFWLMDYYALIAMRDISFEFPIKPCAHIAWVIGLNKQRIRIEKMSKNRLQRV